MKILYITTVSRTINAFLTPHINALLNLGHQVDIGTNVISPIDDRNVVNNCKIYNIPFCRSIFKTGNISSWRKIRKLLLNGNYDVIHVHTPIASAIARIASIGIQSRIMYTAHGFHFYKGSSIASWLVLYPIEKLLSVMTDTLVTINKEDSSLSEKKLHAKRNIHICGVGVDLDKFKPPSKKVKSVLKESFGFNKDDFLLLVVGQLNMNKNQELIIRSMNDLVGKIENIKLLIVGSGENKTKYEILIKDMKLEKNVTLLGYRTDVNSLMKISDILISCSFREGLPVNVIEGMASGLPIIASSIRGNKDLINPGENGELFEPDNSLELTRIITKLYNNSQLRDKYSKENVKRAKAYSLDSVLETIKRIY